MRLIYDPSALETSEERLFPASKHRSKRIHKKLVKRFGGEFRKNPAMYRIGDVIVAHPSFKAAIEANARASTERIVREQRDMVMGIFGPGPVPDPPAEAF